MAQLPPDGEWLVQSAGPFTAVFHRYTEEEVTRFLTSNANAAAIAQRQIHNTDKLTDEQKCFAHFWCGYFYAHGTIESEENY